MDASFVPPKSSSWTSSVVPSHIAPGHRILIAPPTVTSSTMTWFKRPLPDHQYTTGISANIEIVADAVDPTLKTLEMTLVNSGIISVPSPNITQRLPRGLTYVPGSVQGLDGGQVVVTKAAGGATILHMTLDATVAPATNPPGAMPVVSLQYR